MAADGETPTPYSPFCISVFVHGARNCRAGSRMHATLSTTALYTSSCDLPLSFPRPKAHWYISRSPTLCCGWMTLDGLPSLMVTKPIVRYYGDSIRPPATPEAGVSKNTEEFFSICRRAEGCHTFNIQLPSGVMAVYPAQSRPVLNTCVSTRCDVHRSYDHKWACGRVFVTTHHHLRQRCRRVAIARPKPERFITIQRRHGLPGTGTCQSHSRRNFESASFDFP